MNEKENGAEANDAPEDEFPRAAASPTKAFFVKMITRDITLEDSILDLIDNSVDGAWRRKGEHASALSAPTDALADYRIEIDAEEDRFAIKDNCGGLTLKDAVDHAFTFGRRGDAERDEFSIGVYGIGMKRAAFKLGRKIEVRSTYERDDGRSAFHVPIDVDEWERTDEEPWSFPIRLDVEPEDELGVEIVATDLVENVSNAFSDPTFAKSLRQTIARDYALQLRLGLDIVVNGKSVQGWDISFRVGDGYAPANVAYRDEETEGAAPVDVQIIAGMATPPPDGSEPEDEKAQSRRRSRRSGWYVACNGRIVLAADKTGTSGWGTDGVPSWHRQYDGFEGYALFDSADAAALPLTTTKRNVDVSSDVYRRASARMRKIAKAWTVYTNKRKQSLEEAKRKENEAKTVPLIDIQKRPAVELPDVVDRAQEQVANVNYSVPLSKMDGLRREFGDVEMSYRDVGLRTFDFAFEAYVGED